MFLLILEIRGGLRGGLLDSPRRTSRSRSRPLGHVGCLGASEVVPDYDGERDQACAAGQPEVIEKANAELYNRCRAWLKRKSADSDDAAQRPPKRFRVAAKRWAMGVDHMMQVSVGVGLKSLEVPHPDEGISPFLWRGASIAMDQGSDGHCAMQAFGRFFNLNVDYIPDSSHGLWNDIKRSIKRAQLWPHEITMLIVWNVDHGPWSEEIRLQQAKQVVSEHLRHGSPHECPLFQKLAPAMYKDHESDFDTYLGSEDAAEFLWRALDECSPCRNKGRKVSMNRFLAAVTTGKAQDKNWHFRLYGYILVCLQMGFFTKSKGLSLLDKVSLPNVTDGDAPTRRDGPEAKALRAACANALVCATMLLMEPGAQHVQRCIFTSSENWQQWHTEQNTRLRSAGESLSCFSEQFSDGKFLQTCAATFGSLDDPNRLIFCGISLEKPQVEGMDMNHPAIEQQDELAMHCGRLAQELVSARLRRCLFALRGWPANSIRFLASPQLATHAGRSLRTDCANFQWLKEQDSPHAKRVADRSIFHLGPVRQLVACMESTAFEVTEGIKALVRKKQSRFLGSQLIEDGFQRLRRCEDDTYNKHGRASSAFKGLIQKEVVNKVHHYAAPASKGDIFDRNTAFPKAAFASSVKDASLPLEQIEGSSPNPPWYSPGADNHCMQYADLHLQHELANRNKLAQLKHLGSNSSLLRGRNLMLRKKGAPSPARPWMLSLGDMGDSAALAWPAEACDIEGTELKWFSFVGAASKRLHWVCLLDLAEWEACTFEWRSPAWQFVAHPSLVALRPAVRAVQSSPTEDLLKLAARQGFWGLGLITLQALGQSLGLSLRGCNLFDACWELVHHILQTDDNDTLACMQHRMSIMHREAPFRSELFLELDEGLSALDKDEEKDARRQQNTEKVEQRLREDFTERFRKTCVRVRPKAKAKASGSARGSGSQASGRRRRASPVGEERGYAAVPPGAITQQQAKALLPPGASVWKDNHTGNWQSHFPGYRRSSRSWNRYGHRESALEVVRDAWRHYAIHNGWQVADCSPPQGLF